MLLKSSLQIANQTYLYASTCLVDEHKINESVCSIYAIGPGNKKLGINLPKAKLSCSKNDSMPSIDCTQIKSLPEDKKHTPHFIILELQVNVVLQHWYKLVYI